VVDLALGVLPDRLKWQLVGGRCGQECGQPPRTQGGHTSARLISAFEAHDRRGSPSLVRVVDIDDGSGGAGQLARVRKVVGAHRTYIEFPHGTLAWVDTPEPADFEEGQVVLIFNNRIEPAPEDLWHEDPQVSVVRIKNGDVTVLEYAGHINTIPTNDVNYEVGNTVEFLQTGVNRVLDTAPLSILDLPEIAEDAIKGFQVDVAEDLGTFDDFEGLPGVVGRARKLIETPLKYRKELDDIGAPRARGVLFIGEPGTGKTMLARIIARESSAAFYQINGPEIVSKWLGQSEELLRKIFEHAKKEPDGAIIFFDEIDSIAEERRDESHEASRRLVAQLLTLMDSCNRKDSGNVIVIAATNRPNAIDPALKRPGRFDWKIYFPLPDRDGREQILKASSRHLNVVDDLPHGEIADLTESWTPADLTEIWKEAAILAVTDGGRNKIMAEDYIGGFQWVSILKQSAEEYE
jgi:transitional endoplasmic reticulum ATPase